MRSRSNDHGKLPVMTTDHTSTDLQPANTHEHYHAHIYFNEQCLQQAQDLCADAWRSCHIGLGRLHQRAVGPHPHWSCQLTFNAGEFDRLIPWLDEHRGNLSILVHPLTGDDRLDHSDLARWLGDPVALRLDVFDKQIPTG